MCWEGEMVALLVLSSQECQPHWQPCSPLPCCCHPWLSPTGWSGSLAPGWGHCLNAQVAFWAFPGRREEEVSGTFMPCRECAGPQECQSSSTQPGAMAACRVVSRGSTRLENLPAGAAGKAAGSTGAPVPGAKPGREQRWLLSPLQPGSGHGSTAGLSCHGASPEHSAWQTCPGGRAREQPQHGAGLVVGTVGTVRAACRAEGWESALPASMEALL